MFRVYFLDFWGFYINHIIFLKCSKKNTFEIDIKYPDVLNLRSVISDFFFSEVVGKAWTLLRCAYGKLVIGVELSPSWYKAWDDEPRSICICMSVGLGVGSQTKLLLCSSGQPGISYSHLQGWQREWRCSK